MNQKLKLWWRRTCEKLSLTGRVSYLDRKISRLSKQCAKYQQDNENQQDNLRDISKKFKSVLEDIIDDFTEREKHVRSQLDRNEQLIGDLKHALAAAQEEIQIYKEITVPGLMKTIGTYDSARDYQTAQYAMRAAVANKKDEILE